MDIRKTVKEKNLLFDGAFGTYYAARTGEEALPELGNEQKPELVKAIHKEYIEAGCDILRTNTFASNTRTLSCREPELQRNLEAAVRLAKEAVKESQESRKTESAFREIYVAGCIGPIPVNGSEEELAVKEEYLLIGRTLIQAGADFLVFETFADDQQILPVIRQLKKEFSELCVFVHFSMNQFGYTNAGISIRKLFEELGREEQVDGIGVNCGVGPGHMLKLLEDLPLGADKFYSALPNASYPKLMQDRMVFMENREYFVEKVLEIAALGLDCVGGCCGTTPEYLRYVARQFKREKQPEKRVLEIPERTENNQAPKHAFYSGVNRKLVAVELAPPFGANDEKVLNSACFLQDKGVDAITFPDSPSGRTRADSVLMAVKAGEQSGLCAMPHLCCRDKNAIAIRSQLLGAYMNGIRNLLIVTGDPVPTLLRKDVKSVYNFDSIGLMRILQELNEQQFTEDPIVYGGALSPMRLNLEVEIERMKKKIDAGASFFLTQPVFSEEEVERLRRIRQEVPARILVGIMPLVSKKNALFIKNEMAGIHVTDQIVERFEGADTREAGEQVGIGLAREIMEKTADLADGYYFSIPFNRVQLLPRILDGKN